MTLSAGPVLIGPEIVILSLSLAQNCITEINLKILKVVIFTFI